MNKLTFICRLFNNLGKFLLISLPLTLVGAVLLAPYIAITSTAQQNKSLPYLLRWFDCADFYFNRDTSTYLKVIEQGKWARYVWLAFRNPINYFSYKYLGFELDSHAVVVERSLYLTGGEGSLSAIGNKQVGDSAGKRQGLYYVEVLVAGKKYYEYYYILKYSPTSCFRFRMGWKIGQNTPLQQGHVQDVFNISPYNSYSGE